MELLDELAPRLPPMLLQYYFKQLFHVARLGTSKDWDGFKNGLRFVKAYTESPSHRYVPSRNRENAGLGGNRRERRRIQAREMEAEKERFNDIFS